MKKNQINTSGIENRGIIKNMNNFFRFAKVDFKMMQQRIFDFYQKGNTNTVKLKSLTATEPKIKNLNSNNTKKFKNMSSLRNSVQLIGHLGKDPEVKQLESGRFVGKVSIATNDIYKNAKGEKVIETQWHNLVTWGKNAENMQKILRKGDEVAIQGKLTHRSYEDKDGVTRYVTEIVVNEFVKLSKMPQQVMAAS